MTTPMQPDATIEVRFLTANEGGRRTEINGPHYSCPMFIGDEAYDCRIFITEGPLQLGQLHRVQVQFLCPELARPALSVGRSIWLWEGRRVADGAVLAIT